LNLKSASTGHDAISFFLKKDEERARRLFRTYCDGRNVRKVGSNAGGVHDIVEGKLIHERTGLQEQGQGLRITHEVSKRTKK